MHPASKTKRRLHSKLARTSPVATSIASRIHPRGHGIAGEGVESNKMPSLEVIEIVDDKPFETAATNMAVDEDSDDDDKTAEMSDSALEEQKSKEPMGSPATTSEPLAAVPPEVVAVTVATSQPTESSATKKRRVTPIEPSSSGKKKQQQKTVNQMSLSHFFHKASPGGTKSTFSSSATKKAKDTTTTSSPLSLNASSTKAPSNVQKSATKPSPPVRKQRRSKKKSEVETVEPAKGATVSTPGNASPTSGKVQTSKAMTATEDSPLKQRPVPEKDVDAAKVASSEAAVAVATGKSDQDAIEVDSSFDDDDKTAKVQPQKIESSSKGTTKPAEDVVIIESSDESSSEAEKAVPPPPAEDVVIEISAEHKALMEKHEDMKRRCRDRENELVQMVRDGIEEEDFDMPTPVKTDLPSGEEFPDAVVSNMAILIEGCHLPLSKLTSRICEKLQACHQKEWSEDAVGTKIKLIAERKPFLDNASSFRNDVVARYEDDSVDRMWRWELGIIEVLPSDILPKVRKARTARRKLLNHFQANQKLQKSYDDADTAILKGATKEKLDAILGKIVKDEEKVLKFEREAEKQRLAVLAKKKKDQEQEAKKLEKERKKDEAEKKKLEKEREKQEAVEAREEKRKKTEEKERLLEEKRQKAVQKQETLDKQKALIKSFFSSSTPKQPKAPSHPQPSAKAMGSDSTSTGFDSDHFRSLIDTENTLVSRRLFPSLSDSATQSRKRRTRKVPVAVYVTVMPDANGFDEQPFAEQRVIYISNRYRFLSFQEDYRPPYHGTWSKRSKIVTGKNPLGKDSTYLDYDYDSEAEWEEGDDEIGEDVDDDAKNEEDEEEDANATKTYDYDDGFCVADEQYLDIDEDVDEETKALYRRKLQGGEGDVTSNRICIVGPAMGGEPATDSSMPELMEGFEKDEAMEFLAAHTGKQLCQDLLWLDAFAPDKIDELEPTPDEEKPAASAPTKDESTVEDMKALASFAHHCTLNSKEKLIEELRIANPNAFGSRAKATRKLDSIAEKKKCPSGSGVYWEVKKAVLEELMLDEVLAKKLPACDESATTKTPPKSNTKKRKSSDACDETAPTKDPPKSSNKKRKSSESSSVSSEPTTAKKIKVAQEEAPSAPAIEKAKSPSNVAAASLASHATILNFLQPRKKPKVEKAPETATSS